MQRFTFNTAASIHQEFSGATRLGEVCAGTLRSPVLFVTDPGIMELGLAQPALDNLKQCGFEILIFSEVEVDPPQEVIERAVGIAQDAGVNSVIGFGGGSSLDAAKLVALLANSTQDISEVYGVGQATGQRLPLVLVPTTAGTGSEVTPVAIVTTGESEKKGAVSPLLLPDMALLDAELTLGLPPAITAATGIDAMVHAIEAYTSRNPNHNPVSVMLARQALHLLGGSIEKAVFEGSNREARSNMLLGAMLAGQAFANSPVAAVHALAYPIGGIFHVPHGLSNSLVLPHVMRFNKEACMAEYAALAPLVFPDIDPAEAAGQTCDEFIDRLSALTEQLGLETTLRQVGIGEPDLDRLADDSMKQTRLLVNNPRELEREDAYAIYAAAL